MIGRILLVLSASAMCASTAIADPTQPSAPVALNAATTAVAGTAAPGAAPSQPAVSGAVRAEPDIEQRLRDNLTSEMLQSFGLFIYVSKANIGPWAQHMVVFQRAGDELLPLYNWPVSTGRETVEANALGAQMSTGTPSGFYELDPKRMFADYHSTQWNEPMPHAMFFNWKDHGVITGLAIHAASDEGIAQIGTRASAGCVRLAPENAETLFNLVRDNFKGMVPRFGYDKYTGTIMNNGLLLHDADGNLQLAPGYRVLVYIDDYGGESLEAKAF